MNARYTIRPFLASLAAVLLLIPAVGGQTRPARPARAPQNRLVEEKTGSFPVREGQRLRLWADIGNIRIRTRNSGQVSYRVRVEADASQPGAQALLSKFTLAARAVPYGVLMNARVPWREFRGRLWVTFELNVPQNFQLDVSTQTGNIETENIDGRITLVTAGGNVTARDVGGPARLETQGGHITVHDVAGDLAAYSAGGHMNVGNVKGDAVIRTGGGHIRVGSVEQTARLETGGGNISLGRAGAGVVAHTSGGRIDLGETSGAIRASTGGGNIGVLNVAGPTQIDSGGGSICLTNVQGTIRASTTAGTITAWFTPESAASPAMKGKLAGPSQLESGTGDILIFIPRELAITIDAVVEEPAGDWALESTYKNPASIEADPAIPLKVSYAGTGPAARQVRGEAALNGGGEVLRLKTATGRIRLRYADSPRVSIEPELDALRRQIELHLKTSREILEREKRRAEQQMDAQLRAQAEAMAAAQEQSRFQDWQRRIMTFFSGRLRVDANEQKQRLVRLSSPAYPFLARQRRIEGVVRLDVYISSGGTVEDVKVLNGHELLARSAVAAVKQWQYEPVQVGGKAVPVVTTVDVDFRLN
jgi:TonB family protein